MIWPCVRIVCIDMIGLLFSGSRTVDKPASKPGFFFHFHKLLCITKCRGKKICSL